MTSVNLARLEQIVDALLLGDWRTAMQELRRGGDAGREEGVLAVMFCLWCVCRGMRHQCASGDVTSALGELVKAEARLIEISPVGAVRDGRLQHLAEPARDRLVSHLAWATTRLVLRERADLDAVCAIYREIKRGKPELVYATIEYLTWIEFDPGTVRVHPRDQELLGLDDEAYARFRTINATDISARATNLRHLADVRGGSVCKRTWSRMGGPAYVRDEALLVLAGEVLTRGEPDLPVRLGRQRAWEYACQLFGDRPPYR